MAAVEKEEKIVINNNEISSKKRKKKTIPIPVAVEEPIVVEEKTEDEDLSQWLKEHTED